MPRWIIPSGTNLNPLLENWSPYRLGSRILWRGILVAQKVGALGLLPQVERVKLDDMGGINWQAVGWRDSTPPVPLIYIGTPGPRQKAVVHLVDPASGQCGAVVKIPLQGAGRWAIVRESSVLAALEEECFKIAPRLVYFDDARGVATQQFMAGSSGSRRFLPEYQDLLQSLMLPDEHTTLAGHAAEWRDHSLWDFMEPPELALLTSAVAEQVDTSSLPACWAHGDFAPWNIRDRQHLPPALIDWEMGERGALPLQDAYHFLHIQQFLFGGNEKGYSADLTPFAKRIGVPPWLRRKLEIAYLTRSYFTCMEWGDRWRAESLLKSLATVMRERAKLTVCAGDNRRLRLVTSRPANHRASRFELLSAVIGELNRAGIPYCILSGHANASESITSDVDIMFRPADLKRIPMVLAQGASSAGARLVQAIRHETSASFFVLARPQGKHVAHLAVDCYGDYRRDDRTWMLADEVVANRRKYRDFYRPSVADEFIYCLIKKVLKQSISEHHVKHLLHLLARDPVACRDRLSRFWPESTALLLERNLVEENLGWFWEQLPKLSTELARSRNVEPRLTRLNTGIRNAARLLQRILFPTGMLVSVQGDRDTRHEDVADRLICSLAPAFRRTQKVPPPQSFTRSLMRAFRVRAAQIRSTLVIETVGDDAELSSDQVFGPAATHLISRPDLILRLGADRPTISKGTDQGATRRLASFDAGRFSEERAERANIAVLNWLAARTARRLKIPVAAPELPTCSVAERPQTAVECEFVGSD